MTDSRSMSFVIEDLVHAVDQLRATVADLQERVTASEREPRTVTIDDLCTASGLSENTVKAHIQKGTLPGKRVGERYVIPDLEFDSWRRGNWQPREEAVGPVRDFRHRLPRAG